MQFGICTSLDNAAAMKRTGWDYVEENAQGFLQGTVGDSEWTGPQRMRESALPVLAANCLVPAEMKMCGPHCDPGRLRQYMDRVIERAGKLGIKVLVAGSAAARNVPDGFDRETARGQITDFLKACAEPAARHGVTLAVEPLCRAESNIINTVEEAMSYVQAINHAAVRCLVDSYHFWMEAEPLANLHRAMPWIAHVHVANHRSRAAPEAAEAESNYGALLSTLKRGGYDQRISVEAIGFDDLAAKGRPVLAFLKEQWGQA